MFALLLVLASPYAHAGAPNAQLDVSSGVPSTIEARALFTSEDGAGNKYSYEGNFLCTPSSSLETTASTGTLSCTGLGSIDARVKVIGGKSILQFDSRDLTDAIIGSLPSGHSLGIDVGAIRRVTGCIDGTIKTRDVFWDRQILECDYLCVNGTWRGPLPLSCTDEFGNIVDDIDVELDDVTLVGSGW